MRKIAIILLIVTAAISAQAQLSNYIYERLDSESAQEFTDRVLGEYKAEPGQTHASIEGYWGDESKGKKIMAFTGMGLTQYNRSAMVVFQPVGDGKNYIALVYEGIGEIGRYYEGVISLFYMDVDSSGTKELVLIEKGGVRVAVILEDLDDNGNIIEHHTTACCEYEYNTVIIKQVTDQDDQFLPMLGEHDLSMELNFSLLKNAEEVKELIRTQGSND